MAQKVMTGNKDFTVEQTQDGIRYESKELKTTKEVFKVAKKERTEDGYMITTTGGSEYEVFEGWNEYDEDDIKLIRKGSVAAYLDTEEKGFLVCGFSPDFIQKEIKKYFSEVEEEVKEEVENEYASLILILNENDEENKFAVLEKRKLVGNTEKIAEFKYTHFKNTKPSVIYMRGIELYNGTELLTALEVHEIEEIFDDLEGVDEAEEETEETHEPESKTCNGHIFERYANDYYEVRPENGFFRDSEDKEYSVVIRTEEDGNWHTGIRMKETEEYIRDDSIKCTYLPMLKEIGFREVQ